MPSFLSPALKGALCSLLAFTIWACSDSLTKIAGLAGVPPYVIIALSGWSAALVVFLKVFWQGEVNRLRPASWKLHIFRGIVLFAGGGVINTMAFTMLPLTTVYVGLFSAPLILSAIGRFFLGEKIGKRRITAILVGFVGVLIALLPDMLNGGHLDVEASPFVAYLILFLFLGVFVMDMLLMRIMGKTETVESLAFVPFVVRGFVLLPCLFFVPLSEISLPIWGAVFGMGILAGVGYLFAAMAYKLAPVSIVAPFHYTQLISGGVLGYLLWGHVPSIWVWGGAVLIVFSSVLTTRAAQKYEE
ncbi:MAG: DMT family transporter [Bdellovibrionales bacterium]